MHYWPNKSITRTHKAFDASVHLSKRPKGVTDEQWKEIVREFKHSKKVMLDTVPKVSKKELAGK